MSKQVSLQTSFTKGAHLNGGPNLPGKERPIRIVRDEDGALGCKRHHGFGAKSTLWKEFMLEQLEVPSYKHLLMCWMPRFEQVGPAT